MALSDQRREYTKRALHESDVAADPLTQFQRWFDEASAAPAPEWFEANAMTLATASADGMPSARVVLLKEIDPRGLLFYTQAASRKGRELEENPRAAALLFWPVLERQVRVEGPVEKLPREKAAAYFHRRPRASQLGALASDQSRPIESRDVLEGKVRELESKHADREVPVPEQWAGYRLVAEAVELWQGGAGRVHDRLRYRLADDGSWHIERLAP